MKNFKITACIFLFASFFCQAANAKASADNKQAGRAEQVEVKCHVALIDGNEEVLFYKIKAHKLKGLPGKIKGNKVSTSKSSKKISIYKVFECAAKDNEFTSTKSRALDENTGR